MAVVHIHHHSSEGARVHSEAQVDGMSDWDFVERHQITSFLITDQGFVRRLRPEYIDNRNLYLQRGHRGCICCWNRGWWGNPVCNNPRNR